MSPEPFGEVSETAKSLAEGFSRGYLEWVVDGGLPRATEEQQIKPRALGRALEAAGIDYGEFCQNLKATAAQEREVAISACNQFSDPN